MFGKVKATDELVHLKIMTEMKKTGTIVNSKRKIESERLGSKRERGWQNKR